MKCRIVSIVLCLVVGAVINVSVAWLLAWFISQPFQSKQTSILNSKNYLVGVDDLDYPNWYVITWWEIGSTQICSKPFQLLDEDLGLSLIEALRKSKDTTLFDFPNGVRPNHTFDMTEPTHIKPLVEDLRGGRSIQCGVRFRLFG